LGCASATQSPPTPDTTTDTSVTPDMAGDETSSSDAAEITGADLSVPETDLFDVVSEPLEDATTDIPMVEDATVEDGLDVAEEDVPVLPDQDEDGTPDIFDNCPQDPNEDQSDVDDDGDGDVCDDDMDGDEVPNEKDGWPQDPDMPGTAYMETVYAHTDTMLYSMVVGTTQIWLIGTFNFAPMNQQDITDIAIDQYGVLYAISFTSLFTCHPQNAHCTWLASLPGAYNGLTFIPGPLFSEEDDVLIGISNSGNWVRLDINGTTAESTPLGSYGAGYKSSGDSYSIEGVGTFASVEKLCEFPLHCPDDYLVRVDPLTGTIIEEIGPIGDLKAVFGLAGWSGETYAFDAMGSVYRVDLETGETELWVETGESWWGAGVRTRL
jgi:hypothetical protein